MSNPNIMDQEPPLPQPAQSAPTTPNMLRLIEDLKAIRTEDNSENIDRLIGGAGLNYFDDVKGVVKFAIPQVELMGICKTLQLTFIHENIVQGKYNP